MPTGAPLLPLTTTKVGAGEKERAYVIKQNIVLKTLLGTIVLIGSLGILVCSTTYEVHLQRRNSLVYALEHREEEHASHMRIMRLSTLLQKHLKARSPRACGAGKGACPCDIASHHCPAPCPQDEVHDMSILTTYRALLLRAVGDYQARLMDKIWSNCTEAPASLRQASRPYRDASMGEEFDKEVDSLMHKLWVDLVTEGKAAQLQLHNITAAIQQELRQDATEASDFDQLMQQVAGWKPSHLRSLALHVSFSCGRRAKIRRSWSKLPSITTRMDLRWVICTLTTRTSQSLDHLAGALEAFFYRLRRNDSTIALDNATMARWHHLFETAQHALQDEEEEADLDKINRNIAELLNDTHAEFPSYNASNKASELDYFTDLIYRAKLHPYRTELLELIGKWMEGDAPFSEPLHRVEELIDEDVLQPDVLMADDSDEYAEIAAEHYPYDD
ncbi:MAG: hypothetical protein SGPRY_014376 [Prymnesium sp.]